MMRILFCVSLLLLSIHMYAQEAPPLIQLDSQPLAPLTSETLKDVKRLGFIDNGSVLLYEWRDDTHLVVITGEGLWLYDLNQQEDLHFFPIELPLAAISISDDGRWMWTFPADNREGVLVDEWSSDAYSTDLSPRIWNLETGTSFDLPAEMVTFGYPVTKESLEITRRWAGPYLLLYRSALTNQNSVYDARATGLQIWDMRGDEPTFVKTLYYPSTERTPYTFTHAEASEDGHYLITIAKAYISEQHIVSMWDMTSGTQTILHEDAFLPTSGITPFSLEWNTAESEIVVIGPEAVLRYAMPSGEPLEPYAAPCPDQVIVAANLLEDIAVCGTVKDHNYLGEFQRVRLSNHESLSPLKVFDYDSRYLRTVETRFKPGSIWLKIRVQYSLDESIINILTGNVEARPTSNDPFTYVVSSPDNTHILEGYAYELAIGSADTGFKLQPLQTPVGAIDIALASDSSFLLTTNGREVLKWSLDIQQKDVLELNIPEPRTIALSHDQKTLYVGSGRTVYMYDADTLQLQRRIDHDAAVTDLLLLPDDSRLFVMTELNTVIMRDETGRYLSQVDYTQQYDAVAFFLTTGSYLVAGDNFFHIADTTLEPVDAASDALPAAFKVIAEYNQTHAKRQYPTDTDWQAYVETLPTFISTKEGVELVEAFPYPVPALSYNRVRRPVQLVASERLMILKQGGTLWFYGLPMGEK
jgi:hypothetical protein